MPGPRAKVPARVTRKVAPFAAVRIHPVPVTDAALRIVLPNGTRLEVPWRDPEVLQLVVEEVLRQTGGNDCAKRPHLRGERSRKTDLL